MNAVITLGVGTQGRAMLAITAPVLRNYADRIGAKYHAITSDKISPGYPLAAKFQCGQYLKHYDRILFLDSDIIVSPDCPDLFSIVPVDTVGMFDDTPDMLTQSDGSWLRTEYADLCQSQGWEPPAQVECLNTGVIVASREHSALFTPPAKPYPKTHCAEQNLIGLNLRRNGLALFPLDQTFNYQWWAHQSEFAGARPHIAHFAGMSQDKTLPGAPGKEGRLRAMKDRVAELYPHLAPKDCGCGGQASIRTALRG